jgi:hypothetical protein
VVLYQDGVKSMVAERVQGVDSERLGRLKADVDASVPGAVDAFWREMEQHGTLLVEEVEGQDEVRLLTFLWRRATTSPSGNIRAVTSGGTGANCWRTASCGSRGKALQGNLWPDGDVPVRGTQKCLPIA